MGPAHYSLALPAPLAVGIAPRTAHILSLLFTGTYVGSLYVAQKLFLNRSTKPIKIISSSDRVDTTVVPPIAASDVDPSIPEVGSRDHPDTIRIRMKAVGTATVLSLVGVFWAVKDFGRYQWSSALGPTLTLLGTPTSLGPLTVETLSPYLLAPALMLGPLVATYLDGDLPLQQPVSGGLLGRIKNAWESWTLVDTRNYVVGPLTEELVFRSTILAVSIMGKLSVKSLVFGTPLWFGIAHAHHAWDTFKRNGGDADAAKRAVAASIFQLGYTTLFGWFAAYLFLRTGSVLPPLVSHVFCNCMGIYLPTTAVQRHPSKRAVIWGSYVLGIAAFVAGVRRV